MECGKYLIYALVDPIDKNIKYIGRSSNKLSRPKWHLSQHTFTKSHLKVHRWIKGLAQKGLEPKIEILESWQNISNSDLNKSEIKWISIYKPLGHLHNLTDGGDGTLGMKLSEKHRNKIINSNKNRTLSEHTINKMKCSARSRSRHRSKKTIVLSDGREFMGLIAAATALGCSKSHVSLMIKFKLQYNGYIAFFKQ